MGNSHSAATKRRDEERNRLAYLGDRYPFGDEEILRLARCHSYLRNDRHLRKSFLSDWAAFCATLPSLPDDAEDRLGLRVIAAQELCGARNGSLRNLAGNGNSDELDESLSLAALRRHRTALMQVVEGRILPSGFGRRLERAAFLFSRDVVDYHESTIVSSPGTPGTRFSSMTSFSDQGVISCFNCNSPCCGGRDSGSHSEPHDKLLSLVKSHDTEEIAFMRLEKFLEGASDCGRRGARGALKVLFKCCIRNSKGGHTADDTHYCSGAAINGNTTFVSAHEGDSLKANIAEVIEVGYSLSLAASFLSAAAEVESLRDINPADFIPEDIGTTLTQSLLSFSAQKKREIMGACYGLDGACGADGLSPLGQMLAMDKSSEGHSRTLSIDSGSTNSTNVHGERAMVTLDILLEWAERTAPCLSACLSTFMHHILFPDRPYPPSRTPFVYPDLKGQESAFFKRPTSPLLFTFACMSPSLGGWWHRLYTSESDGLSFNRLQLSLLGYAGPTLIIIRSTNGGIFGAFTSSPWKESGGFYGSSDCFLYQLLPNASVYRPRGGNTNFMYCNSTHRSKGYDGLAHGIGFGGTTEEPRLFIAESFDGCVASSADMTFESGPLLPPYSGGSSKDFEISDLEVWGVGGEEAVSEGLGARDKQRDLTAANIKKARKVDKAAFLDDFQSGMIDSKAFKHRDQIRGRADYCIDEHDPNNYVRDKRL
mmetsp:Transcript_16065/g.46245  ORF Transcript_16065/g.46245 Transcript_16065/m.46245 type:complete len:710 (-) Transcript_16065:76-2205(-)